MTCATCGHELRPDARYCPRCGTPANATPPPAHWQAPPGPQGGPGVVGPVPIQAQPPAQGAPPLYPPAQYPPAQYPPAQPAPQFGPPAGVPSGVSRFGPAPVYPQAAPPAGFPMGPPPQPPAWPMGAPPPQHVPPPVPPGAAAVGRAFPDDTQVRRGPVPPSEEHTFVAPRPGPATEDPMGDQTFVAPRPPSGPIGRAPGAVDVRPAAQSPALDEDSTFIARPPGASPWGIPPGAPDPNADQTNADQTFVAARVPPAPPVPQQWSSPTVAPGSDGGQTFVAPRSTGQAAPPASVSPPGEADQTFVARRPDPVVYQPPGSQNVQDPFLTARRPPPPGHAAPPAFPAAPPMPGPFSPGPAQGALASPRSPLGEDDGTMLRRHSPTPAGSEVENVLRSPSGPPPMGLGSPNGPAGSLTPAPANAWSPVDRLADQAPTQSPGALGSASGPQSAWSPSGPIAVPPPPAKPVNVPTLGRRLGAGIADGLLVAGWMMVGAGVAALLPSTPGAVNPVGLVVTGTFALVAIAYWVVLTARGQTLGKRAFGYKVVGTAGNAPPGFGAASIRCLVAAVLSIPAYLGFLSVLRPDGRGFHDLAAKTRVVLVD